MGEEWRERKEGYYCPPQGLIQIFFARVDKCAECVEGLLHIY
jgi:hypothetical protein